jgi:acyl carrier protein
MDRTTLMTALVDVLHRSVGKEIGELNENSRLIEDLNLDSLDFVAAAVEIQCEFNVEIKTEDFQKIVLVKDLVDLVQTKLQSRYNAAA